MLTIHFVPVLSRIKIKVTAEEVFDYHLAGSQMLHLGKCAQKLSQHVFLNLTFLLGCEWVVRYLGYFRVRAMDHLKVRTYGKRDYIIYIYIYIYIHIPFQILFPYRLLQNIEYSSLCSTVGTCWISVLYIVVVV